MLFESDVIDVVCANLINRGYVIQQRLSVREHGVDVIAVKEGSIRTIFIEAKGETSSSVRSKRYGRLFNRSQALDHIAIAVYQSMVVLDKGDEDPNQLVAIALPDNSLHRECVGKIRHTLDRLKIGLFWVASSKSVTTELPWEL